MAKHRITSAVVGQIIAYTDLPKDGGTELGRAEPGERDWLVKIHGATLHEPWLSAWYRDAVRWVKGWTDTRSVPDRQSALALLRFAGAHAFDFGRGPELFVA